MRDRAWMHEWQRHGEPPIWWVALQVMAWVRIRRARAIARQWGLG